MRRLWHNIVFQSNQLWRWVRNFHRSGQRWGRDNPTVPGETGDFSTEMPEPDRLEIVRKAHYFESHNAIVNKMADLYEQYTVGPHGLQFIPSSSDEAWNAAARRHIEETFEFIDLTSLQNFGTLQGQVARIVAFRCGEIFILKTRGSEPVDPKRSPMPAARPRIQLIESHRVCTPPKLREQEGRTIFSGIKTDGRGRPIGYYVRNTNANEFLSSPEDFTFRTAEEIIHVFEPSRPGQYRGLPLTYPVIEDLQDIETLQYLEILAAKDAAEKSNVLISASGEVKSAASTIRNVITRTTQDSEGNPLDQTRIDRIQKQLGGRTIGLRKGEDLKQFQSNRPGAGTQWLWDYLTWKICAGVGIPKLLVFPASIQGTVARADFDIANAFFRSRSAVLASYFKRVYLYVLEWGIQHVPELKNKPADWKAVKCRAPRSVNVDVGRNSVAAIAELIAGGRTWEGWYSELGDDYVAELTQKAKEARLIRNLASTQGVTPAEVSSAAIDGLVKLLEAEAKIKALEKSDDDDADAAAAA